VEDKMPPSAGIEASLPLSRDGGGRALDTFLQPSAYINPGGPPCLEVEWRWFERAAKHSEWLVLRALALLKDALGEVHTGNPQVQRQSN
jgi:hypothetical protein